jgi:DNA-binding NarL/FixJ family response regulator
VLIADDHALVREGLRSLVEREPDLVVVGEAADGREAVERCLALDPDVVLMDVRMPHLDGLMATARIKALRPAIAVVVVTMHDSEYYVREAEKAGASGYVLKDASVQEIVGSVRRAANPRSDPA